MNMKSYCDLLSRLKIKNLVFTSISSKDKEIALKLIRELGAMKLNYWCMYDENGKEQNISGDKYSNTISKAISDSCVFILLVSKHSIVSKEVYKEIEQFFENTGAKEKNDRILIPVFLGDVAFEDIPEELVKLSGITSGVISRKITANTDGKELREYAEEICEQYIKTTMSLVVKKLEQERASCKFSDLMALCARNKCDVQTVSEDIKGSNEISAEKLKEAHILSNELLEYDYNTYSCMVIASNLLGNAIKQNGKKCYRPEKEGVKYFYYHPKGVTHDCRVMEEKIKRFIAKDTESRREVVSLICREFTFRNKIHIFFGDMNGKTQEDLKKQYHVKAEAEETFDKFFELDSTQCYFEYSNAENDVFRVPEEFLAWLRGDRDRFPYEHMIDVADEFIKFIGEFIEILKETSEVSTVAFKTLKRNYTYYLERLQKLGKWQMGKISLTHAESKKLVNYLLDFSEGAGAKTNIERTFPRLASWMEFATDKNSKNVDIDEETQQKALNNLVFVPIADNETLKLCYSFIIFISNSGYSGAWYTTGQRRMPNATQDIVMTYNIDKSDAELYEKLMDAFAYMISVNPQALQVLKEHKSQFLSQLPADVKNKA